MSRALERDLTGGRAHLLTAEVVAARGAKQQALLELRLAVTDDSALAGPAARLAGRWTKNCDELASAAPIGAAGAEMLCTLAVLVDASVSHCRPRLVEEALSRAPGESWPRSLAASGLLEHLRNSKSDPTCAGDRREKCEADIERHARVLETAKPQSSVALVIRAHVVRFRGNPEKGEQMLKEGCPSFEDREGCLRARVEIAAEARPPTNLIPAIKDYLVAACVSSAPCADASTAMADVLAARGDWGTASTFYERAARESPTEARWLSLANAASQASSHAQAAAALEKAAQLRGHPDPELRKRIEDEKRKALGLQ
ncbi:MAG: hypothetical protein IPI67_24560 [Myxococcales bacterium]|nr:hypothetical protein [Myxococcales bacterium]